MCEAVHNYAHLLGSVPNFYETQKLCDKAVNTFPSTIQFVLDQFKTRAMCDKAVDTCPFVFDSVPDQYTTQKLCDKIVSKDPFMLKYCHDKYKTQKMCYKAVDFYLLKFVPDWLVTSKMIEKLDSAVFPNGRVVFGDLSSDVASFFSEDVGLK